VVFAAFRKTGQMDLEAVECRCTLT
jgi:hypothetical protein